MMHQQHCPICLQQSDVVQTAIVSPWIRELGSVRVRSSKYRVCQSCESGFFDYRYSDREMTGIYSGYRDSDYVEIRRSWEPSYTAELNDSLGNCASVLDARHNFVISALSLCGRQAGKGIGTVVDVGGDRGQFIPPSIRNKFVVDVSDKSEIDGVTRLTHLREAIAVKPDLVMACGILEHLSNPRAFIRELLDLHSVQSSMLLYVEVPSGVPRLRPLANRLLGNTFGRVAARSRWIWRSLDRRAAVLHQRRSSGSLLMPLRQSEHINFFSKAGLSNLASMAGLNVLLLDSVDVPSTLLRDGRVQFSSTLRLLAESESL